MHQVPFLSVLYSTIVSHKSTHSWVSTQMLILATWIESLGKCSCPGKFLAAMYAKLLSKFRIHTLKGACIKGNIPSSIATTNPKAWFTTFGHQPYLQQKAWTSIMMKDWWLFSGNWYRILRLYVDSNNYAQLCKWEAPRINWVMIECPVPPTKVVYVL